METARIASKAASKTVLASVATVCLFMSAVYAQQNMTGMITKIDRLNGTISILPIQSGTVGANTGGATDFKAQDPGALENVHAGDRVTYSTSDENGVKTITKIQKQ